MERWLAARNGEQVALGLGRDLALPRTFEIQPWRRLGQKECTVLRELRPRYVVINPKAAMGSRIFGRFMRGELGYEVVTRFRQPSMGGIVDVEGIYTNLHKIARDMVVLERTGDCVDLADVITGLDRLRQGPDPELRVALAEAMLDEAIARKIELGGDMTVVGLSPDHWTHGTSPAGLAVRNRSGSALAPLLWVRAGDSDAEEPAAIRVEDGDGLRRHVFERPGRMGIELPPVPPGSERLYVLWSERLWETGQRSLGLRVLSGEWVRPDATAP